MVTSPEGDRDVVEVLGTDQPPLRQRWRALSRRARLTVAASACAVVLAVSAGYLLAPRPSAPAPAPVAGTGVRIRQVGVPARGNPYFGITLRAAATSLVAVAGIREGYPDLILRIPSPGRPLAPGRVRTLSVRAAVCDCWLPRPPLGTPLLYLALRSPRGERYVAVVPTRARFARLDRVIRRSCGG
ncbi:hypothetical protein ACYF6T_24935 [Streptomyces sp. 7R007]